jgi:hypothetical protein
MNWEQKRLFENYDFDAYAFDNFWYLSGSSNNPVVESVNGDVYEIETVLTNEPVSKDQTSD